MKTTTPLLTLITVLAVLPLASAVDAGHPEHPHRTASGWFDMQNCGFCKQMTEDPGLLSHMHWESHKTPDGSVSVTTVDDGHRDAFDEAMRGMQDLAARLERGDVDPSSLNLCGHCQFYGKLMMAGARFDEYQGDLAHVSLVTSDDPEVVAMIHEMVDRNEREMHELMGASGSHAGHEHRQ